MKVEAKWDAGDARWIHVTVRAERDDEPFSPRKIHECAYQRAITLACARGWKSVGPCDRQITRGDRWSYYFLYGCFA